MASAVDRSQETLGYPRFLRIPTDPSITLSTALRLPAVSHDSLYPTLSLLQDRKLNYRISDFSCVIQLHPDDCIPKVKSVLNVKDVITIIPYLMPLHSMHCEKVFSKKRSARVSSACFG